MYPEWETYLGTSEACPHFNSPASNLGAGDFFVEMLLAVAQPPLQDLEQLSFHSCVPPASYKGMTFERSRLEALRLRCGLQIA